jgi:hypothetical protein
VRKRQCRLLSLKNLKHGNLSLSNSHSIFRHFIEAIETKPIKHAEKLYYYYAWLLTRSGNRENGELWAKKSTMTTYNRIEALAMLPDGKRAILREYPFYGDGLVTLTKQINEPIIDAALEAQAAARGKPKAAMVQLGFESEYPWTPNEKQLLEIGELYEQMGDFKRAAHAYQSADITGAIDVTIRIYDFSPHPAWERLAALYEKIEDWDMALHWRLKQLAGTTSRLDGQKQIKPLTDKVIYLLARIGAGEPVKPLPAPKYEIDKLRRIFQNYLEMGFPNFAQGIVGVLERLTGEQSINDHARLITKKADILYLATSRTFSGFFWVVLWDEVWTYDKVVAVHKQAIEWGRKAGWDDARLKKLEDQITKLPDLLKYVKEPKNFQDLLEGKATEPKW